MKKADEKVEYLVEKLNAYAQELGIEINDLHSIVMQDLYQYIGADQIHLSEAGIDICAKQVVKVIKGE